MGLASKMASYAAPVNPPVGNQGQSQGSQNPFTDSSASTSTSHAPPTAGPDHLDPAIPEEAPPAYTPAAPPGDAHLAAGPSRMDFSGPPPMSHPAPPPPRHQAQQLESQITGVGVGYGPRRDQGSGFGGGGGLASPSGPPPMPPRHASEQKFPSSPSGSQYQQAGGPSIQAQDRTPTQVPTPGRPLLRNGQLLVYPKGFMCHKCECGPLVTYRGAGVRCCWCPLTLETFHSICLGSD